MRNKFLYGVPGSGKTHTSVEMRKSIVKVIAVIHLLAAIVLLISLGLYFSAFIETGVLYTYAVAIALFCLTGFGLWRRMSWGRDLSICLMIFAILININFAYIGLFRFQIFIRFVIEIVILIFLILPRTRDLFEE